MSLEHAKVHLSGLGLTKEQIEAFFVALYAAGDAAVAATPNPVDNMVWAAGKPAFMYLQPKIVDFLVGILG